MNLQKISTECSCWIPQFHRVLNSQCFCWYSEDRLLMLMMKSKDYIEMLASFGSGIEMDDSLINWLNRFVCHRLKREGFCQQYKISDVLLKQSKDILRKTPILQRRAAAPHIEGELSSAYMATKFISTTGRKRPSPKWLLS